MISRRLVVSTVAALLAVSTLVASQPAAVGREMAPQGGSGIGDPYFPLDGNAGINVLSYDIADRYRFKSGRLTGTTSVRLRATETLSSFNLDLLLRVRSVRVNGRRVDFEKDHHELVVHRGVRRGQVITVLVRYAGRPANRTFRGEQNWLASREEAVAMNQPHMAPWWFPSNDHPRDRAKMTIRITAPKDKQVIANGRRVKRSVHRKLATTTWRADEPMVPYLAFFAAGSYAVAKGRKHRRPWYVAVSELLPTATQTEAMALMKRTPGLLKWLEGELGGYPFSTTGGLVTSLEPGFALENQTRPTYSPASLSVSTVVHELAHQWLGDSVSLASWSDIWLNEGAATFMEWRYAERHGGGSAQDELLAYYDGGGPGFWDLEVADPCATHVDCVNRIFDRRVYQRGAMTLQALRNVIGEDDFWRVLRRWVADREGRTGTTAQFEALAAEVSGQDLDGFFHDWLHSAGKPADTAANGLG